METRREFHVQVDVRGVAGEDLQQRMIESWMMAFSALNIPFCLPMARMQTMHAGSKGEYHQLVLGLAQNDVPSAPKIRAAVRESLAIHQFPHANVDVVVYEITKEIVGADTDKTHPIRKGALAA